MHKVERVFHPIGQGAFYSERHYVNVEGQAKIFNMVYDCGNWRNTKASDKVVQRAFNKNYDIDILFISHFDFDHISKISTLKDQVKSIKKVIIPLLDNNEIDLLTSLYKALGLRQNVVDLVSNPDSFFDDTTKVIKVEASDNHNEPDSNDDTTNLDDLNTNTLASGARLILNNFSDWCFIPFNYKYSERNERLKELLKSAGFDVSELENGNKETIESIVNKDKRKELKDIYDKLEGGINQNSMVLYSGPKSSNHSYDVFVSSFDFRGLRYCYPYYHRFFIDDSNRPACVFTGDADFNKTKIKQVFSQFWDAVGTIQIPHHGDLKSFDSSVLGDRCYFCPISVGKTNSYGHPSTSLLAQIAANRSVPILVTEDLTSGFIQIIERH